MKLIQCEVVLNYTNSDKPIRSSSVHFVALVLLSPVALSVLSFLSFSFQFMSHISLPVFSFLMKERHIMRKIYFLSEKYCQIMNIEIRIRYNTEKINCDIFKWKLIMASDNKCLQ